MKTGNNKKCKPRNIQKTFLAAYKKKSITSDKSKTDHTYLQTATNVMFNHMSAKKGIKLFKERAIAAIYKEFKQLDEASVPNTPVVLPQDRSKLTIEEKGRALEAVNLIEEKVTERSKVILGQMVASKSIT